MFTLGRYLTVRFVGRFVQETPNDLAQVGVVGFGQLIELALFRFGCSHDDTDVSVLAHRLVFGVGLLLHRCCHAQCYTLVCTFVSSTNWA